MSLETEEIELRSDEVQEILKDVPSWMIRWGNTLFLVLIGLLLFLSWLIKYPDTITARAKITTEQPPTYIVNKVSGVIEQIVIKEDRDVKEGEFIGEIQSPSNVVSIEALSTQLKKVKEHINNRRANIISIDETDLILGDAQNEYSRLLSLIREYNTFSRDPYYNSKISSLRAQINQYKTMSSINTDERSIGKEDMNLARERLKTKRKLYAEELISRMELLEEESEFKRLEQSHSGSRKNKVQNDITITEYNKQIADLDHERKDRIRQYQFKIEQAILNLENMVDNWGKTYTITAPIDGKLSYLNRIAEKQFVNAGDTLMAIIPNNTDYLVEVMIPSTGVGKVEINQKVHLKLDNYPYAEYGQVVGSIEKISAISKSRKYFALVKLDNGLLTTYKENLTYSPDMQGTAEIITQDLNILERVFNKFNEMIAK